jgi:hypothetical protein
VSSFFRRQDVEITLPLPALENLFVAPTIDPFSPDYTTYGDRSGMDHIAARLRGEGRASSIQATIELPPDAFQPGTEKRATEAVERYCRVKVGRLDEDLHEVTRHGIRALLFGLFAVFVLSGLARPLDRSDESVLQVVAEGLQVTSWVILWVPIGLLVYDRWYYSRDRKIYGRMQGMEIRVVSRRD